MATSLRDTQRFVIRLGLLVALGAMDALAEESTPQIGVDATISSDHIFRGVSQTLGRPALEASLNLEFDSGFYTYLWAANVDFVPDSEPGDGADIEVDVAAGYATALSEQWSVDLMLVRYLFPGTIGTGEYDYSELLATLWFEDHYSATVGYSNDVFGEGEGAMYYSLGAIYELPAEFSVAVELGQYDLDRAYGASYSFADVSLSRTFGKSTIAVTYINTRGDPHQVFYAQSIGTRFVVSIQLDLLR